jgi:hypothetical protein
MPEHSRKVALYYLIGLIVGLLILLVIYYVVPRYQRGFVAALIAVIFFVIAAISLVIEYFYSAKKKIAVLEKAESLGFTEKTDSGFRKTYRNKQYYISPEREGMRIGAMVRTRNVSGRRINFSGYNDVELEKMLGRDLVQKANNLEIKLPDLSHTWASIIIESEKLDKITEVMDLIVSVERIAAEKKLGELNA